MPRVRTAPLPALPAQRGRPTGLAWWQVVLLAVAALAFGSLLGFVSDAKDHLHWVLMLSGLSCVLVVLAYRLCTLSRRIADLEHQARIVHLLVDQSAEGRRA